MKTISYDEMADLVDFMIEQRVLCFGRYNTIVWLYDFGFDTGQIMSLGFDIKEIDEALTMYKDDEGIDM